jgi:hypothetical protein
VNVEAIILFCMVDKKSIPLDRLQRGCLSCSKECGAEGKRHRNATPNCALALLVGG